MSADVVIVDRLTRRFGEFTAVDQVSLRVGSGTVYGFVGPSGSGKTTVIRMLCGLLKPTSGSAIVAGCDVAREPEKLRHQLGYMSQRFSLYPDLTVRENLEFYGGIYRLPAAQLRARIASVLERLQLEPRADVLTDSLPLGWKQRVALGAALLHNPPLLFLDEPTSGVDPASQRLFWELLDELTAGGTTIFVTTHTMDEVERCHRVGIMHGGRLIADDTPQGLRTGYQGTLYEVEAEPLLAALDAAQSLPHVTEAVMFGNALHVTLERPEPEPLAEGLRAAGVAVASVNPIAPTMEDVFVQLVQRETAR